MLSNTRHLTYTLHSHTLHVFMRARFTRVLLGLSVRLVSASDVEEGLGLLVLLRDGGVMVAAAARRAHRVALGHGDVAAAGLAVAPVAFAGLAPFVDGDAARADAAVWVVEAVDVDALAQNHHGPALDEELRVCAQLEPPLGKPE